MTLLYWQILQQLDIWQQYLFQLIQELNQSHYESTLWVGDGGSTWIPGIQVWETKTEVIVRAKIPHLMVANLDIQLTPETLLLQGEQGAPREKQDYVDFEFCPGHFRSLIPLPALVQPDGAIAQFNNDFLTLTLRKSWREPQRVKLNVFYHPELESIHEMVVQLVASR